MGNEYKPAFVVLQQFTQTMFEQDPMGVSHMSNEADEYEPEALSVLSRFRENALCACDDAETRREIALGIVKESFDFWFNAIPSPAPHVFERLTDVLLEQFMNAYPTREQATDVEVPSET